MATFKTTHVGSLPRPQEMITKIQQKKQLDQEDLKKYLGEIMGRQMSMGIDYINNGELPRSDYISSTISRISGFDGTATAPTPRDMEEIPEYSRRFSGRNGLITLNPKAPVKLPACSGPLSYRGKETVQGELEMMEHVFNDLKPSHPNGHGKLFFTAPSPGTIALFMQNQYYPDHGTYLDKIGTVLKKEYDTIAGYGFHLQVDCPDLAMGRHTGSKHLTDAEFVDQMAMNIRVLNQALSSVDPDKCRVHICWGNYAGPHHCDIDLREIFHPIMEINARFISLEACNHRHSHEWTLFEEFSFPEDKVLMPGVIDTGSNIIEHPDLVARQIIQYANILGTDRVIPSTDCGFATTATATSVSGEIAWLKLASMVEGARRAGQYFKS